MTRAARSRQGRSKLKPKRSIRRWFTADLEQAGGLSVLVPSRGCRVVTVEIGADEVTEQVSTDADAVLWANIGDRLILCGRSVDETQAATVLRIEHVAGIERLHLHLGYGGPVTSAVVHVLQGAKAGAKVAARASGGNADTFERLAERAAALRSEPGRSQS